MTTPPADGSWYYFPSIMPSSYNQKPKVLQQQTQIDVSQEQKLINVSQEQKPINVSQEQQKPIRTYRPTDKETVRTYRTADKEPLIDSTTSQTVEKHGELTNIHKDLNDTMIIMKANVGKIIDRDEKLDILNERASELEHTSIQFSSTTRRLKNKMWWENKKYVIILVSVILILVLILAIVIYAETKK